MIPKTVKAWVYVNKDGYIGMSLDTPQRDEPSGKWIVKMPYCNTTLYDAIKSTVEKTNMNWQSEPEFFEINL